MENNRSYYTRREAQERSAAATAHGKARQAHEKMAEIYHDLAEATEPTEAPEATAELEAAPERAAAN